MSHLCEVCERKEALYRCRICGRYVCGDHLIDGVCVVCRDLTCKICHSRLAVDTCPFCGRIICRECSVELQPGIRVCKECFKKMNNYVRKFPALKYYYRLARQRASS